MQSLAALSVKDREFHHAKGVYAYNSIAHGLEEGRLEKSDVDLIEEFITELKAQRGIGILRANKIIYVLVNWRRFIGPYRDNSIADLYRGISTIKTATNQRGRSFKQNTLHDHIVLLKQFYLWMIENGYTDLPAPKVRKVKPPAVDTQTKLPDHMLTKSDIEALIRACQSSRDRALIAVLYESGCRIGELGRLTWERVRFDDYGAVLTVDDTKCGTQRYVRLVFSRPYLATWRNDYPVEPEGKNPVFITRRRQPLQYGTVRRVLKNLTARTGIQKRITPHIFRHSRITHLINDGMNESVIKLMMWGNINTDMFATYAHITGNDIDRAVLGSYGIVQEGKKDEKTLEPVQCPKCSTINAPGARYCYLCGRTFTEDGATTQEGMSGDVIAHPDVLKKLLEDLIEEKRRNGEL